MTPFRFGVGLMLQAAAYAELRETAQAVDATSFDIIAFRDQYTSSGTIDLANHEVWTLLGGLMEATCRVRFVPSVLSAVRHDPRTIAAATATLDWMSNGRIEVGIGAGGLPDEHRRYGIPFPSAGERVARLQESIQVIRKLWKQPSVTHQRRFFRLDDVPGSKPMQQPYPPITVAGGGEQKSLRIVARYAQSWRAFGAGPDLALLAHKNQVLDTYCREIGRAPATLERTQAVFPPAGWWHGDTDAALATLHQFADAGTTCFMMIAQPPFDLPAIDWFSRAVIPAFRAAHEQHYG